MAQSAENTKQSTISTLKTLLSEGGVKDLGVFIDENSAAVQEVMKEFSFDLNCFSRGKASLFARVMELPVEGRLDIVKKLLGLGASFYDPIYKPLSRIEIILTGSDFSKYLQIEKGLFEEALHKASLNREKSATVIVDGAQLPDLEESIGKLKLYKIEHTFRYLEKPSIAVSVIALKASLHHMALADLMIERKVFLTETDVLLALSYRGMGLDQLKKFHEEHLVDLTQFKEQRLFSLAMKDVDNIKEVLAFCAYVFKAGYNPSIDELKLIDTDIARASKILPSIEYIEELKAAVVSKIPGGQCWVESQGDYESDDEYTLGLGGADGYGSDDDVDA